MLPQSIYWEARYMNRHTNKQTDTAKLIVAFLNSTSSPKEILTRNNNNGIFC
jgi:hypothetical protein